MKLALFFTVALVSLAFVGLAPTAGAAGGCDQVRDPECQGIVCYGSFCVRDDMADLCRYMDNCEILGDP